jgi:hypothetical protein
LEDLDLFLSLDFTPLFGVDSLESLLLLDFDFDFDLNLESSCEISDLFEDTSERLGTVFIFFMFNVLNFFVSLLL